MLDDKGILDAYIDSKNIPDLTNDERAEMRNHIIACCFAAEYNGDALMQTNRLARTGKLKPEQKPITAKMVEEIYVGEVLSKDYFWEYNRTCRDGSLYVNEEMINSGDTIISMIVLFFNDDLWQSPSYRNK